MYSYGPPHMAVQKQDDQHEHTFSSFVRIRDVVLKTCLGRWTIGRSGVRGSGISVLPTRHDDDDDEGYLIELYQALNQPLESFLFRGKFLHTIWFLAVKCGFPFQRSAPIKVFSKKDRVSYFPLQRQKRY